MSGILLYIWADRPLRNITQVGRTIKVRILEWNRKKNWNSGQKLTKVHQSRFEVRERPHVFEVPSKNWSNFFILWYCKASCFYKYFYWSIWSILLVRFGKLRFLKLLFGCHNSQSLGVPKLSHKMSVSGS